MTLEEALAASTVNSAAFPNVEDIVYRGFDQQVYWWLGSSYRMRDKPLPERVMTSDGWHPIQPIAGKYTQRSE